MEGSPRFALRIALMYAAFGAAWILLSDVVVSLLFRVPYEATLAQTLKGSVFVLTSAALIYGLVRRESVKRAQTEDSLAATRSLMTQALDSLGEAVLLVSREEGRVLACNRAAEQMFGYRRSELVGDSTEKLHVDGTHYQAYRQHIERALANGEHYQTPFKLRRRDGEIVLTEHTVTWVRDDAGEPVVAVSVIRDVTSRRLAEVERERLAAILEVTTDFVGMADSSGRTVFVNRAGRLMLAIPDGENLEGVPLRHYHPEWAAGLIEEEALPTAVAEGVWRGETAVQARDGRIVPVSQLVLAHKSEDGTVEFFSTVARDISERKRIETELQEREEWYRSLIENVSDAISVIDSAMTIVYASPSSERVFGYESESLVGRSPLELFHEEDHRALLEALQATLANPGSVHNVEARARHSDGSWRRLESVGMRPPGADRIIVISRDVTPRWEAEEALRRSREIFSTIFETIPMATGIATAREGRFLEVNQALLDLLGMDRKEVVGRTGVELEFWVEPEARQRIVDSILRGESVSGVEVQLRGRAGSRTGLFFGERVELEGDVCLLGIFYDVTERKEIEAQLFEAQKMEAIGRLAGGVAHDFNNLLTSIIGFTQLAQRQTPAEDPRRTDLDEILYAAERAASLTRQLLAFSRRDVLQRQPLELNAIITGMEDMIRRMMGEDVRVIVELDPDLHTVHADRGQIEQIVMNLAVNSRDAMPDGGRLVIQTRQVSMRPETLAAHPGVEPRAYARLCISDTGCGMDQETQDRMFEPFFTTKEPGKGTGLGLATVYGIVSQSRGFFEVHSSPDEGSAIHVFLPTGSTSLAEREAAPAAAEETLGSETIVVVEDDDTVRSLCRHVLERSGYTVLDAGGAEQALQLCRDQRMPVHLLLTDLVMPEMNGRELARAFTREHPEAGVLFMSGYADERVMRWGDLEPGVDWLQKPFTAAELTRRVREALDERKGSGGRARTRDS
jgi:PAS domain S-box-containing protein